MENTSLFSEILYPGKIVQIEVANNKEYKLITKTTVSNLNDTQLTLNLPSMGDFFNRVLPDTEIIIICKHNDEPEEHVFISEFIKVAGTEPPVVVLNIPSQYKRGRQYARLDVELPFSFFMDDQEIKAGMVNNLSLIGLLATIKPNGALKEGHHIVFKLCLPTEIAPLLLTGKINRIVKGDGVDQIALHFPHIQPDLQDKITKYLFIRQNKAAKQRQQHRTAFIKID